MGLVRFSSLCDRGGCPRTRYAKIATSARVHTPPVQIAVAGSIGVSKAYAYLQWYMVLVGLWRKKSGERYVGRTLLSCEAKANTK